MAHQVKDRALSLQWLESLLGHGFDPWSRNFHVLWVQPKTKTKERKKTTCTTFIIYIKLVQSGYSHQEVTLWLFKKKSDREFPLWLSR